MLTLRETVAEDDSVAKHYDCNFVVDLAGDSIWSDTHGMKVRVTGISVIENWDGLDMWLQVNVTHDAGWEIYTDSGFELAISNMLGFAVCFTEQGMQEDGMASMEA